MVARFWPVSGVVGENGAFYFRYDHKARKMIRHFAASPAERADNRRKLEALAERILKDVPGAAIASDQLYREADLAIDFREDVEPLPPEAIDRIVALFHEAGAVAKVSSIHVNGWFGAVRQAVDDAGLRARCARARPRGQRGRCSCSAATARTTSRCSGSSRTDAASPTCGTSHRA